MKKLKPVQILGLQSVTKVFVGDSLEMLRSLPDDHFHCAVTSPPYFGLRDYGTGEWEGGDPECDHHAPNRFDYAMVEKQASHRGSEKMACYRDVCGKCGARRIDQQIGLEETPDAWAARLVEVFREVRRVLRPDGTFWLNVGDSYAQNETRHRNELSNGKWSRGTAQTGRKPKHGVKQKDLIGAPWLLAFALRDDGWYLRSEIIWHKPNPMPESVRDRPTKAHEQVFLLTKSGSGYFFDQDAVREQRDLLLVDRGGARLRPNGLPTFARNVGSCGNDLAGRNVRSVWTITTEPLPNIVVDGERLDHFAAFPVELARRCIQAGTSGKGCCSECGAPWRKHKLKGWAQSCKCAGAEVAQSRVLDPFSGSGRTAIAADLLGCESTLIELNPQSVRITRELFNARRRQRSASSASL